MFLCASSLSIYTGLLNNRWVTSLFRHFDNEHRIVEAFSRHRSSDIESLCFAKACILKIPVDQFKMLPVIHIKPHANSFRREASVWLWYYDFTSWLEYSANLLGRIFLWADNRCKERTKNKQMNSNAYLPLSKFQWVWWDNQYWQHMWQHQSYCPRMAVLDSHSCKKKRSNSEYASLSKNPISIITHCICQSLTSSSLHSL